MNYCIQCKWHTPGSSGHSEKDKREGKYDMCNAPQSYTETSIVTGAGIQKHYGFCENLRKNDDLCGLAGAWFEPLLSPEIEEIKTEGGA